MAAMISVPPVLPLCRKTMASDKPVKQTADDERHEVLSLSQYLYHLAIFTHHPVLRQSQEHGEHDDGVDGLHHELESQISSARQAAGRH